MSGETECNHVLKEADLQVMMKATYMQETRKNKFNMYCCNSFIFLQNYHSAYTATKELVISGSSIKILRS